MLTEGEVEDILYETGHGEEIPHHEYRARAAAAIVQKMRKDWGTTVSCDAKECLYNRDGECAQDEIYLNAYQMCESVDMG